MLPFLNPRSPDSMLSLCHGILPKVVSALFTTLNWGGGGGGEGETKFVLSMFNNFVILAGMVLRVLSKIVDFGRSRDQRPPGTFLHKRKEPGNKVGLKPCHTIAYRTSACQRMKNITHTVEYAAIRQGYVRHRLYYLFTFQNTVETETFF